MFDPNRYNVDAQPYSVPARWTVVRDEASKKAWRLYNGRARWSLVLRRCTGETVMASGDVTRDDAWSQALSRVEAVEERHRQTPGYEAPAPYEADPDMFASAKINLASVGYYLRTGRQGLYLHSTDERDPAGRVLPVEDARALAAFLAEHLPALDKPSGE